MATQNAPKGLSQKQLDRLSALAAQPGSQDPQASLQLAEQHLELAVNRSETSPIINIRLGQRLLQIFREVAGRWQEIPLPSRPWLCAAMRYFASSSDEIPDFTSMVGFEDDARVTNACLELAGLAQLRIPEKEFE